jgi:5,6-dimethylbenzimidazole synthase
MAAFPEDFRARLLDLMRSRRDMRRFRDEPLDGGLLRTCLDAFTLAPSVGLSDPWRVVSPDTPVARAAAGWDGRGGHLPLEAR